MATTVNHIDGGRIRLTIYEAQVRSQATRASLPGRLDLAYEVALEAIDRAPVVSGAFRDGIDVAQEDGDVFIVDNDPIAFMKEYGTVDTEPIYLLTAAAEVLAKYNDRGAFAQALRNRR